MSFAMKRTVEKTVLAGFVVVLALFGFVGVVSQRTIVILVEDTQWVTHTHTVLELLQRVSFAVTQAEASVRGYVITENSNFEVQYHTDKASIPPLLSELSFQTADNPVEQRSVAALRALIDDRFSVLDQSVQLRKTGGLDAVLALRKNSRGLVLSGQISSLVAQMRNEENRLLQERSVRAKRSQRRAFIVVLLALFLAMLAVLACVLLVFRDLTRERKVERMKSEFVSVVSHELRTPLTSIHGSLGLLAAGLVGADSSKGKRMLEIAVNNTDRLIRLLNDILDVEKLDSGKIGMRHRPCSAGELMRVAADVMHPMAQKHGVTLELQDCNWKILADPDRVEQCLTNLLSNAIKFSDSGSRVKVRASRIGNELRFEVSDQGRGIPAGKQDEIFERFHQVDASDSRRKGGTGLGLAISRSIVQQHGGRIWVESELGKGSTFFFTMPLAKTETGNGAPPDAASAPAIATEQEPDAETHPADRR
jgi:signal transduction histidine kinase